VQIRSRFGEYDEPILGVLATSLSVLAMTSERISCGWPADLVKQRIA
jgi:hypothetical protein